MVYVVIVGIYFSAMPGLTKVQHVIEICGRIVNEMRRKRAWNSGPFSEHRLLRKMHKLLEADDVYLTFAIDFLQQKVFTTFV